MTKYVAIYARLSPRPDGSYEGVADQTRQGQKYAAAHWPGIPVRVFSDKGRSAAAEEQNRPGYDALRAAVAQGEVAHIWAVEQSRLERREIEWFRLAAELDAAGITELHTNRDGIVRVRDEVASIKAVLAASEVRKLKKRVNDRLDAIADAGLPAGGVTFGYRRGLDQDGNKTLVVDEDQAAAIRDAASWILSGWSLSRCAAELSRRGLTGARGGKMAAKTVRHMVTNPTVAGWRVHRGQTHRRGTWQAILDEDTWNAVRDKLSAPRLVRQTDGNTYPVNGQRTSTARRYLLTGGIAVCGVCEAPLIASMKQLSRIKGGQRVITKVVPYLLCHPKTGGRGCVGIMCDETEAYVAAQLLAELDTPAFRQALAEDGTAAVRDEITGKLRALESRRTKLAKRWAAGDLTDAEWDTGRVELAEREATLRAELAAVPPPAAQVDVDLVREAWPRMNLDERREIVGMFVEKVVIRRAKPGTQGFDSGRVGMVWRRR